MVAAAITWTAHPQSMEAMAATDPIVFVSAKAEVSTPYLVHQIMNVKVIYIPLSKLVNFATSETTANESRSTAVSWEGE